MIIDTTEIEELFRQYLIKVYGEGINDMLGPNVKKYPFWKPFLAGYEVYQLQKEEINER